MVQEKSHVRHRRVQPSSNDEEAMMTGITEEFSLWRNKEHSPIKSKRPSARMVFWVATCTAGFLFFFSAHHSSVSLHSKTMTTDVDNMIFTIYTQSGQKLTKHELPNTRIDCSQPYLSLPFDIDDDPYLPWIHDYFVTPNISQVRFIAQNKRRCETGKGKQKIMEYWEPQISLFQQISILEKDNKFYLTSPEQATYPETRFMCRFHGASNENATIVTMSEYPFNYEYINWRKRGNKPMFVKKGPDVEIFDYATLLFSCPIPEHFQKQLEQQQTVWLDLIPIRTPVRYDQGYLLTADQIGPDEFSKLHRFNTTLHFDSEQRLLPPTSHSGRIANLPLCLSNNAHSPPTTAMPPNKKRQKHYRVVACTWAAATYNRRGNQGIVVQDAPLRLLEWITFHQMVGYDHIYVYDNTQSFSSSSRLSLKNVTDLFPDFVTHIQWPAPVCSNNFIGGRNPGERSSQYAAEASCRERFGPLTEWMSSMDIDEYLVPLNNDTSWSSILDNKKKQGSPVLGMRSSRALPRIELMDKTSDAQLCHDPHNNLWASSCLIPRTNEMFLRTYSCESVRSPRPYRYFTNMKQIYQPSFVLSHFVHYSVVTRGIATYYKDREDKASFTRKPARREKGLSFLNELKEGTMVHARSVLPHETANRDTACKLMSEETCMVGIPCPDSTPFDDKQLDMNLFTDEKGNYCNCWINEHIEKVVVPKLRSAMKRNSDFGEYEF